MKEKDESGMIVVSFFFFYLSFLTDMA